MTILFDENISHHLTQFLHHAAAPGRVQHVRNVGWNRTPDIEWMRLAIAAEFAILTADRNDRTRGLAAQDLKAMGARVMLLGSFWDHLSIWEKAKWLIARWERIVDVFGAMPAGTCAVIDKQGNLTDI